MCRAAKEKKELFEKALKCHVRETWVKYEFITVCPCK